MKISSSRKCSRSGWRSTGRRGHLCVEIDPRSSIRVSASALCVQEDCGTLSNAKSRRVQTACASGSRNGDPDGNARVKPSACFGQIRRRRSIVALPLSPLLPSPDPVLLLRRFCERSSKKRSHLRTAHMYRGQAFALPSVVSEIQLQVIADASLHRDAPSDIASRLQSSEHLIAER